MYEVSNKKLKNQFSKFDEASNSVTNLSVLLSPTDAQNVSCLGIYGRDICSICYA